MPFSPDPGAADWLAGLTPLQVRYRGTWDPATHPWGDAASEQWVAPIVVREPRPLFEMEQVLPRGGPRRPGYRSDPRCGGAARERPILCGPPAAAADRRARPALHRCPCAPRALRFRPGPRAEALAHFTTGVELGRRALGEQFDGVLSWYLLDNRPYLRCLHGYGLCLWRIERFEDAARVLEELLWLNPSDNQGARSHLAHVLAGNSWADDEE